MGSEQAVRHISNAKQAHSVENKVEHIIQALDALAYAMRELESKVRNMAAS